MPRTPEQNEAIRTRRKEQLRRAGLEVYLRLGATNMEMQDVCQTAGVGRGTVYHYYPNKWALLQDVFWDILETSGAATVQTLNTDGLSPLERLRAYYRLHLRRLVERPGFAGLTRFYMHFREDAQLVFGDGYSHFWDEFGQRLYKPLVEVFEQAREAGSLVAWPPDRLAQLTWGALVGALTLFTYSDEVAVDPESWINDAVDGWFSGIGREK